jgi:hypothetical protein
MNMTLEQEQAAVEYRLAEIEDETSQAHRDHAFEYWYAHHDSGNQSRYHLSKTAFNRAHMLYCQPPRLVKIKPSPAEMFALYAIGVVCGIAITLIASLFIITPN